MSTHRLLLNVALSLTVVALSLGIGEIYVRHKRPGLLVAYNERVAFCQYDSEIGWISAPAVHGRFFDTQVIHNSRGQRDKERRPGRAAGKFRAMVIGDSFVWGFRINAADRFTDRRERSLPGTEIMNFGCSGYGQDQEYLLLKRELPKYAPDLVVVAIHVDSDLDNNVNSFQYGYYKPLFVLDGEKLLLTHTPVPKRALGSRMNAWMTPRLALWNLVASRVVAGTTLRSRFVNRLDGLTRDATLAVTSGVAPVEMTCRLAAAIDELATTSGTKTLFMLNPNVEVADQTIDDAPEYAALRTCLEERSLAVLDLEPHFRRHLNGTAGASITLPTDRHWSAEGNRVVSEVLRGRLAAMGLTPPS